MSGIESGRRWLRPASIALFVGAPLLLAALTVSNLMRWSDSGAAAAEKAGRIAQIENRIRTRIAEGKGVQADTSTLFLAANTNSLARAELQHLLVGHVERAGGRLIEVRGDEEPETADQRSIVLRLSLDIGNDGLFDLLSAIETGLPILNLEAVNIRPVSGRTSNTEEANPVLRIALAIRGYQNEAKP